MARVTPGRSKTGRYPAMWQSVPMESFIQPSVSQHLVSKEHNEHTAGTYCNKDTSGSKFLRPKKEVGTCYWKSNNNAHLKKEDVENRGLSNNQICQTRASSNLHSAQRHHSKSSKSSNTPTFCAPSQNMFLSNEDDFPSLCSPNSPQVTGSATIVQETSSSLNTSYSEKLKHVHHNSQQNKVEERNVSVEKDMPLNNYQSSSFNNSLPKHGKKSGTENRRNCPTNLQDSSNYHWSTPHRNNMKFAHTGSASGSDVDQAVMSPAQRTQSENQKGKIHCSYINAKENCTVKESGDVKISPFLSRTQGNITSNSCHSKLKITGERDKPDTSNIRYVESSTSDFTKDFSPSLRSASRSKKSVADRIKEHCSSSQVPSDSKNVPNVRAVGKVRTGVKNNASRPSKVDSKHSVTGEENEKHVSSEVPSSQESARNLQQGASAKTSKKRKNRKSKLKRNLAFQTGKIMILTPELYSRFTGNVTSSHSRTIQDFSFDLRDTEEYPELGQVNSVCSDKTNKTIKTGVICSLRNDECDPPSNSADAAPKPLMFNDEPPCEKATSALQNNSLHNSSPGTATKSEQSAQNVTDETFGTNDSISTCKKPGHVPRKRVAILEPEKSAATEEKVSLSASEQKPKIRHDSSFEISFSDILSSRMVKVKSETGKNRKQSDSRIKVISSKKVKMDKNLYTPPNPLDSSRPIIKRGKERERPKPKKHTALKRIILKERDEKKLRRNMLVRQENLKNEQSCQKVEEQVIPCTDREGETETEICAEDPDYLLCNYQIIEDCTLECCEGEKDEKLDENLNVTVEAVNDSSNEKTEVTSDVLCEERKMQAIQIAVHTRHFREYCNHLLSTEIDQVTLALLGDLTRFQDRLHQKDPVKARIKRRLVYGIKEVTKHLKLKKVKCVILAPDSENIKSKGGLNDALSEIVRVSAEYHIPCVFALRRKTLGKACMKPVPVACVGIFNYDGSEVNFKKLIELQAESKKAYDAVLANLKEQITKADVEKLIETQENSPQSLQDVRITVLRETLLEKNLDLHLIFTPSGNVQLGRKEE